jgi:hypothetical protein
MHNTNILKSLASVELCAESPSLLAPTLFLFGPIYLSHMESTPENRYLLQRDEVESNRCVSLFLLIIRFNRQYFNTFNNIPSTRLNLQHAVFKKIIRYLHHPNISPANIRGPSQN